MTRLPTAPSAPGEQQPAAARWRGRLSRVAGPRALLAIVVLGVVVRLVAMGALGTAHQNLYEFGVIGQNVVDGRGYTFYAAQPDGKVVVDNAHAGHPLPSAFMPPGYTIVVAGAEALGSSHAAVIRWLELVNLVAAAVAIVLAQRLGSLVFGARAGTWAAFGFAFYPVLIYQATQPSASNLYLPIDLVALIAAIRLARRPSPAAATLAGGAIGLVCLFRAEAVIWIPLILVWLLVVLGRRMGRRALRPAAIFLLAAVVLPGAWMVRNSVVLHAVTPSVTTTSGFNLWVGNHPGASGSQKKFTPEPPALQAKIDRLVPGPSYEVRRDALYRTAAENDLTTRPSSAAALDAKKLLMTLTFDFYDSRARNPAYLGSWIVLLALGLVGLVRRRGRVEDRALLYGYLVLALAVPTVFFALARYKLGVEAPLLLFAGEAVAGWIEGGKATAPELASSTTDDRA